MIQSDAKVIAIVVITHIVTGDILALVHHILCKSYYVFVPRVL